ncbi:MAG: hypothetical protein SGJ21_03895 [Alphaproteobacteria bacterium]|nr:hypothetical protein [Alphaproteobacteria bacterium]
MQSTWKYWDLLIVIGGLVVGFGVWFVPNFMADPTVQELMATQIERRERAEAYAAEQARIEKEREDLGIVYFPSPVTPPVDPRQ